MADFSDFPKSSKFTKAFLEKMIRQINKCLETLDLEKDYQQICAELDLRNDIERELKEFNK